MSDPVPAVAPAAPPPAAPAESAPFERCPNCAAPLQGPFCFACGQSKKGLIRHFSSIIGDFLDSVLALDSRTWRTLGPLYVRPGYLSNEYFAGRRVRYVTPLRLYFFLSIIAFLVIAAASPDKFDVDVDDDGVGTARLEELAALAPEEREKRVAQLEEALQWVPEAARAEARADFQRELDEAVAARERTATAGTDAKPAQRDEKAKARREREDDLEHIVVFGDKPWHRKDNPLVVSWLPEVANEALNDEIEVLIGKVRRLKEDPAPFVKQIFATAPQALFVILPVFALLLKVFFIFKRRLYMEHLIVALHSHSFICFSLIVLVLLTKLQGWLAPGAGFLNGLFGWMIGLSWAWIPLYLLLMQKRVYRQNWIFTLFKYGLIGICYVFLLTFGMLLTMLVSLVLL